MLSNFILAVRIALGHSSPRLDVVNDACATCNSNDSSTTSKYSSKFSSGCTGALLAIAPAIK